MRKPYALSIPLLLLASLVGAATAIAQTSILPMELRVIDHGGVRAVPYEVRIELYTQAEGGSAIAPAVEVVSAPPLGGLIRVRPAFDGSDLVHASHAAIAIRRFGHGSFVGLSPRVPLGHPPRALFAHQAASALAAAPDAIAARHIVPGSLTQDKVNTAQVQVPVTGTCGNTAGIRAVNANGTVSCQAPVQGEPGPRGPPGPSTEVYLLCNRGVGINPCNCPNNRLVTRRSTAGQGATPYLYVRSVNGDCQHMNVSSNQSAQVCVCRL